MFGWGLWDTGDHSLQTEGADAQIGVVRQGKATIKKGNCSGVLRGSERGSFHPLEVCSCTVFRCIRVQRSPDRTSISEDLSRGET